MSLYFKIIFGFLCTEIAALTLLLGPLPLAIRHRLVKIRNNTGYVISSLSYGIKMGLLVNTIFFVDSVHRVRTLAAEEALGKLSNPAQMHDVATSANFRARKVYAQRNMYLTGFALFLAFVLVRVFNLVANETAAEDRIKTLESARDKAVKLNGDAAERVDALDATQKERQQKAALDKLSKKAE